MQGNSSAVAAALIGAIDKQNSREPDNRELFLNYSADDPALTNANCSFWHFRFDAHAGMRMDALADVIQRDKSVKKVYLLNQDYSFGHDVSSARAFDAGGKAPGHRGRRRRISSDRPREGFRAVHRQDPRERRGCGYHWQLGQRSDAVWSRPHESRAWTPSFTRSTATASARQPRWAMPASST